ncbi:MAG: T9SS type A sorting domain-containing protein [Saprospiraceae bacterium]|nr:T9SS type A sorting domain-containing protein [Saprospiraceae bacterium]MCF8250328.1 T9SS type A sorting domain-containing protein [Saprospiraceae bacterium]MCF8281510.1 T9SS type A sorting domain-containing protein [Bacteroidales bacterium]MCF8312136.1 T9SS type A sorting domain-containing protein [Saprospiraceae bacterium]MCF8442188.1 T9SS type A sorting domain-containing protein [Saprospiraceae bacterium]
MIRTNFSRIPVFSWAFLSLLLVGSSNLLQAQVMVCNNLVQVSVDNTPNACQGGVNADQILEGNPIPGHDYLIEITHNWTPVVSGLNQVTITNSSQWFNTNLTVKITDQTGGGNSCWGQIHIEDKLPPVLTCTNIAVNCSDDLSLVAGPTAVDNCDSDPTINLTGEQINTVGLCANGYVTITRNYVAIDASGNTSNFCSQVITVNRPIVVDFPNDIIWTCEQYNAFPNIITAAAKHRYVGDSNPATNLVIDVNLNPDCDDNDDPLGDNASVNSTNLLNGGTGCPGNGLDDADVLALTGSGVVANIVGQYCNYQQSKSDQVITICGSSFKVVRTWTVLNWCTGLVVTVGVGGEDNIQVIKVMDTKAPVVTRPPFTASANVPGQHPQPCKSVGFLPPPTVTDNCNGTWTIKINTPIGEAVYLGGNPANGGTIPAPGLPLGPHIITYQVTDACGNVTSLAVPITVIDDIAPATICLSYTDVNLTTGNGSTVFASAFNSATYDNCCLDHFEVRRMTDLCDDNHIDTIFGPSVVFCCEDVANSPVMVVFRAFDCFGNYNDCMVEVKVNDKLNPTLVSCPPNQRITCNWYADNLETQLSGQNNQQQCTTLSGFFGSPTYSDNCGVSITCNTNVSLNQCLEGTITRSFTAKDASNNTTPQACNQTIFVDHVSDWAVEFPADITVNCGSTVPDFGDPKIFYENCELVAISYDDVVYAVNDACYKIVRDWTIINWCVVGANVDQEVVEKPENQLGLPFPQCDIDSDGDCDGRTFRDSWRSGNSNPNRPTLLDATRALGPDTDPDSDPWDGYIVYQQIIKVNDTVDPVFVNNCILPDVCINGTTCGVALQLPLPEIEDCSPNIDVTAQINFGGVWVSGFGPFNNVGPGTYVVRYVAKDNCNNQTACNTTLTVKDCKKPTPYCKNGLVIELMQTGMVDVWASDLNAGSFDNCPGTLKFSFSADVNDIGNTYTCDEVGQQIVQLWVTDAANNQDFCETFIIIQDNMGTCGSNDPLLAGVISNEASQTVEGVSVSVNSPNGFDQTSTTSPGGMYSFLPLMGNDYTITPTHDIDPLNGVSTFDLVLISKHVLGSTLLGSPYKVIAADANKSNSVTTFDIVEIRKLILNINTTFPSNTSWRFVDKDFVFQNPDNPFENGFPEIININDFGATINNLNFVAIKIGDVNGSAAVNLTGSNEERSKGTFELNADDRSVTKGEEVTVEFSAKELDVMGFQFTLNFDVNALKVLDVKSGVASEENFGFSLLKEGALTASWNGTANENSMFSVVFLAKESGKLSEMVSLNSRFTKAEAYRTNSDLLNVQLTFNNKAEQQFALYQNTPNPFKGMTTIGFNLPKAGSANLKITDVSGKVLKTIEREFAAGYNEVQLNSSELPATGIVYYSLNTGAGTATKRMVILE